MKGLLLFTVENINGSFDPEIVRRLRVEQQRHQMVYHMEHVRVLIGADRCELDGESDMPQWWRIRTTENGDLLESRAIMDSAGQLVAHLFYRIQNHQDTDCDVVFIGGDSGGNTAAMQLGAIIREQFTRLFPIRIHLMLLQDQLAYYHNPTVAHFMDSVVRSNAMQQKFYTSFYLLAWEKGARENTLNTIDALVKVMVIGEGNPLLVPTNGDYWVETATVTQLTAPIEAIRHIIFKHLTQTFAEEVLESGVYQEDVMKSNKGLEARSRGLQERISEIERANMPDDFNQVLEIMPQRDPPKGMKERDMSTEQAWKEIFNLYGHEVGDAMRRQLNPNADELEAQYAAMVSEVTHGLLRESLALCRQEGASLGSLQHTLETLGAKVLEQKALRRATADEEVRFRRYPFWKKEEGDAVTVARIRRMILRTVYNDAMRRFGKQNKEARAASVGKAVGDSVQYSRNFLLALRDEFNSQCDRIFTVNNGYYDYLLEDAYTGWCTRNSNSIPTVTLDDFYALVTDEVLALSPDEAARTVCGELIRRFDIHVEAAMNSLMPRINQFFREIAFRSEQLTRSGRQEDLIGNLIQYMQKRTMAAPIMFESVGTEILKKPVKRAFLFHKTATDGDSSDEFARQAMIDQINVINDRYEDGVLMIVKYAGNALHQSLVYVNNRPTEN